MPFIFLYLLKLSVCLAAVFMFYHVVLRKLTFYNWNRYYLLLYSLLSFFIPLVDVSGILQQNNLQHVKLVQWVPSLSSSHDAAATGLPVFSTPDMLLLILMLGVLTGVVRLLMQCTSFQKLKRKATPVFTDEVTIYQVDADIIPFSFGKSIFVNQQLHTEAELQEIIRHEFVHVRQQHSIDIILCELLCVINWFNPFAWMLKHAVRQNLEFVADDKVLQNGVDKKTYQYMLLKVTGSSQFSITSQFNFSSLKKRIAMMNKMKTAWPHLIKFLFVVPLLAVTLLAFRNGLQTRQIQADTAKKRSAVVTTDRYYQQTPVGENALQSVTDTLPDSAEANNKGYFVDIIGRRGNTSVLISDKNNKEVKRVPIEEWNRKEQYYESTYGELPAPPPPPPPPAAPPPPPPPAMAERSGHAAPPAIAPLPPAPPLPPTGALSPMPPLPPSEALSPTAPLPPTPPLPPIAPKLPSNVKRMEMNNKKATVWLKNGKKETYDLTVPAQKEKFDEQYMLSDMKESSTDQ